MNKKASVLLAALMCAAAANAADKACLLEGSLKIGKQVTEIKDCMQNGGVKTEQFLETCKGIAKMGAAMGAPPKITYLDACPASPQGVCDGMFGQPVQSYYYKRDPKDLADTKASCLAQGGKWKS
ncbi:hypothetical protein E4K72_11035 [Oxalobacteraceae bacterium OM1]|nr:hypothetical protein E4K72_11035 [Oxalobacteraceae bacterium OM1]